MHGGAGVDLPLGQPVLEAAPRGILEHIALAVFQIDRKGAVAAGILELGDAMTEHTASPFLHHGLAFLVGRNERSTALLEHVRALGQISLAVHHLLGHVTALAPLAEGFPFGFAGQRLHHLVVGVRVAHQPVVALAPVLERLLVAVLAGGGVEPLLGMSGRRLGRIPARGIEPKPVGQIGEVAITGHESVQILHHRLHLGMGPRGVDRLGPIAGVMAHAALGLLGHAQVFADKVPRHHVGEVGVAVDGVVAALLAMGRHQIAVGEVEPVQMAGVAAHPVVPRHGEAAVGGSITQVEQSFTTLEGFGAGIGLYQLGEVGHIDGDPGKRAAAAAIETGEILPHDVVDQDVVAIDQQIARILARQVTQELGRLGAPLKLLAAVAVAVLLAAARQVEHQQVFGTRQGQVDPLAIGGEARRERVGDDLAAVADAGQVDLQEELFSFIDPLLLFIEIDDGDGREDGALKLEGVIETPEHVGQPGFAAIGGEGDTVQQARQALGVARGIAVGFRQGDELGLGQSSPLSVLLKLGKIIDGELAGHGVGEQQAIVVGQCQPAGSLGGFCIQLEVARPVISLKAPSLEQRDPEPLPLGIEDDAIGSMAGGDRLFQLEFIIQEQQAIAAVIGDQQGAVIGAGQLAQIAT